jgi:hypothetical protein
MLRASVAHFDNNLSYKCLFGIAGSDQNDNQQDVKYEGLTNRGSRENRKNSSTVKCRRREVSTKVWLALQALMLEA